MDNEEAPLSQGRPSGGELLVDFSPKNGPPSASGRVRGGGAEIAWPDGNVWTRFEAGSGRSASRRRT